MVTRVSQALSGLMRVAPPPNLRPQARIVVVKPCCLGDLLLATSAIAALRRALPKAHITVATGAWSRPVVEGSPDINDVVEVPPVVRGPGALLELTRSLWQGRYDAAVMLDRSPLVSLAAFCAGIPVRGGLNSSGRGFSLTHPVSTSPVRHEAELYVEAVRAIAPSAGMPGLRFWPSDEDLQWARQTLGDIAWVAIHPGGGVNPGSELTGKRWPRERFRAVAERLLKAGVGVAIVGGPGEGMDVPGALDLAGNTSFGQLGALLARCRLFVGNDTGPMHLAVAAGTPVVAIFGPSYPEVYGPRSGKSRVIYHGEHCSRCRFREGLVAQCRNGFACTGAATEEDVWSAIENLLGWGRDEDLAGRGTAEGPAGLRASS
jgi:lipopolysaccharide heptosyltransferase II